MSAMSEVVPLPSFGEVFFDARGQERVLRVTWHEGTLVLSLWRGEMCTASFRMPFQDVQRLLETLEVGFAEASKQLSEQAERGEERAQAQGDYPDYPGTGQYVRPEQEGDPARAQQPGAYGDQSGYQDADAYSGGGYQDQGYQDSGHYSDGGYQNDAYQDGTASYSDGGAYQDSSYQDDGVYQDATTYQSGGSSYTDSDPRLSSLPTVGPNDVLVARGNPAPDKLVASGPASPSSGQYGGQNDQYSDQYGGDRYSDQQYSDQQYPDQQYSDQQYSDQQYADQYGSDQYSDQYGGERYGADQYGDQYGTDQYGQYSAQGHGYGGPAQGRHGGASADRTDPYGLDSQGYGAGSQGPEVDPSDPLGLNQVGGRSGRHSADYPTGDYSSDYGQGYQSTSGPYPQGYQGSGGYPAAEPAYTGGERQPQDDDRDPHGRRREW
jgi:hypothetical protein